MKILTEANPHIRFRNIRTEAIRLLGNAACERCPDGQAVYIMTISGASQRVCLACTRKRGITAVWLVGACAA